MFSHTITGTGRRAVLATLPLVVAAALVASGTAAADPTAERQAEIAAGLGGSGATGGVGYRTVVSPDLRTVAATVDNGTFVHSPGSTSVEVISATGAEVSEVPLTLATVGGNVVELEPTVSADGRTLSLAPRISAAANGELKNIATNPAAANPDPVQNGAAAGAGIGALFGAIFCIPSAAFFIIGYFLCGIGWILGSAIVGAVIGAVIGQVNPEVIPQVLP